MTQQVTSLQELFRAVWSDQSFKQDFLNNPKIALAQVGVSVADDVDLTVLEETEGNVFFIIPTPEVASQVDTTNDAIGELITRAANDAALRAEMLADPKAVIVRETGLVIPEEANVSVFEQTADKSYFILPRPTTEEGDRELSESELEAVAAGGWFIPVIKFTLKWCPLIYKTIMRGVRGCLG